MNGLVMNGGVKAAMPPCVAAFAALLPLCTEELALLGGRFEVDASTSGPSLIGLLELESGGASGVIMMARLCV